MITTFSQISTMHETTCIVLVLLTPETFCTCQNLQSVNILLPGSVCLNHTIYSVVFTPSTLAGMEPIVVALVVGILVILLVMVVVKNQKSELFFLNPSPSFTPFLLTVVIRHTFAIIGGKYEQALL